MKQYLFDVKLFAAVRVTANSEVEARQMLHTTLDYAEANLGCWPDGKPILCEVSVDGYADLIEEENAA